MGLADKHPSSVPSVGGYSQNLIHHTRDRQPNPGCDWTVSICLYLEPIVVGMSVWETMPRTVISKIEEEMGKHLLVGSNPRPPPHSISLSFPSSSSQNYYNSSYNGKKKNRNTTNYCKLFRAFFLLSFIGFLPPPCNCFLLVYEYVAYPPNYL